MTSSSVENTAGEVPVAVVSTRLRIASTLAWTGGILLALHFAYFAYVTLAASSDRKIAVYAAGPLQRVYFILSEALPAFLLCKSGLLLRKGERVPTQLLVATLLIVIAQLLLGTSLGAWSVIIPSITGLGALLLAKWKPRT
jgi:hypothetical protein